MLLSSSRPLKLYPKYLAAFTRASSSGDDALYARWSGLLEFFDFSVITV